MQSSNGKDDAWVLVRLAALERANRLLWGGVALSFTTLISLGIAGALIVVHLELPGAQFLARVEQPAGAGPLGGGAVSVDELEVRTLRVVDDSGRSLIWLGRETEKAAPGSDAQAVIGLFAADGSSEPQQTVRLATSRLGSALSLSSPDGSASSSLFAGKGAVSLELRRGDTARTLTEQRETTTAAAAPREAEPAAQGARRQADARAVRAAPDGSASIDLTDPVLQAIGSGFLVSPTSVTDSNGGLRVRGRIVNATSLDQARAEFRLAVGGREVPFTVARIGAGDSAPFVVELPPSPAADVRAARMRWTRSNVGYGED